VPLLSKGEAHPWLRITDNSVSVYNHTGLDKYTSRFVQISKQTTSIAHLGVQRFAEMNFPLVSIDAQIAIVDALSAVVAAIPELKKRVKAASTIRNQVLMEGASR
jgi:restriction endonuclease S subunit